jgi:hypothetical protein
MMAIPTPVPPDPQWMLDKLNSIIDTDPDQDRRSLAYAALNAYAVANSAKSDTASRTYNARRYRDLLGKLFPTASGFT